MQIFYNIPADKIVTYTHGEWKSPGEYTTKGFACIQIEAEADQIPVKVLSLGDPTDKDVSGYLSYKPELGMGHVYLSPSVDFEPVPEVV